MRRNTNLKSQISDGTRKICFVTGSRAEFGLMASTLHAIRALPSLKLHLIVTGMHLDPKHGAGLRQIEAYCDAPT